MFPVSTIPCSLHPAVAWCAHSSFSTTAREDRFKQFPAYSFLINVAAVFLADTLI